MSQGFQSEFLSYVKRNSSAPSYPTTRGSRQTGVGTEGGEQTGRTVATSGRGRGRQIDERTSGQGRGGKSLTLSEQLWEKVVLGVKEDPESVGEESAHSKPGRAGNLESSGVVTRSGDNRAALERDIGGHKSGAGASGVGEGIPGPDRITRSDSQPADSDDSSVSVSPLPSTGGSVESSRPTSASSSRPGSALGWSGGGRKRYGLGIPLTCLSSEPTHAVRISASEGCTVSPRPVRPAGANVGSRQKSVGDLHSKDPLAVSGTSTGGFTPYGRTVGGGRTTRARSGSGSSVGSACSIGGNLVSTRRSSQRTKMKDPALTDEGGQVGSIDGLQLPHPGSEDKRHSRKSPSPAIRTSERKGSKSRSPSAGEESERRLLRRPSVGLGAVCKSPSPSRESPRSYQIKSEELDSCLPTQTLGESPDSGSSGSSKTSPVVEPMLANRPKRNIIPKNLQDFASGLSWREENDLKKALYASLQESRKLSRSTSVGALDEKSHSILGSLGPPGGREGSAQNGCRDSRSSRLSGPAVVDESSQDSLKSVVSSSDNSQEKDFPFRTRIHAQRKFAQGSRPGSPTVTPVKPKPAPRKFFTTRRAKTEDFLTFLCLRGSHALPPHLDFYNIEDSDENGQSLPTTPRHSQSGSRPGTPALGFPVRVARGGGTSRCVSPTASKGNSPEREISLEHNDLGVRPLPRDDSSLLGSPVKKCGIGKNFTKGPSLKPLSRSSSTLLAKRKSGEKILPSGTLFPVIPLKRLKQEQVKKAAQLVKKASAKVAKKAKAKQASNTDSPKKSPKRRADSKPRSVSASDGVSPKKKEKLNSKKSGKEKAGNKVGRKKAVPSPVKTGTLSKHLPKKTKPTGGSELLLRSGVRKQAMLAAQSSANIPLTSSKPIAKPTSGKLTIKRKDNQKLKKKPVIKSGKGPGRPRKERPVMEPEPKEGVLSDTDTDISVGSRRSTRGRSPEKLGINPLVGIQRPEVKKASVKTSAGTVAFSQKRLKAAKSHEKASKRAKEHRKKSKTPSSSKSHRSKKTLTSPGTKGCEGKVTPQKKLSKSIQPSPKKKDKSKSTSLGKSPRTGVASPHFSSKAVKKLADVRVKDPTVSHDKKNKNKPSGAYLETMATHIPKTSFRAPFPSPSDSGRLVDVPTYHPSAEQFHDPIKYISSIRADAEQFGMCRIVPPDGWKPECQIKEDMRFTTQIQYIHRTMDRWGPNAVQVQCIRKYLDAQQGGITLDQAPMVGGVEIDLPALRETMAKFGGLQSIIDKNKLVKVADNLKVPQKVHERTNKTYDAYCKYLLAYDAMPKEENQRLERQVLQDIKKTPSLVVSCLGKGRSQHLSDFFRYSRHTMGVWFKDDPSPEQVEMEYWRLVTEGRQHVAVQAANVDASVCGSGFPTKKDSPYSRHGWNFNILRQDSDSLLKGLGTVTSVTSPTVHVNMVFSTSCWSSDRHLLPYMAYMHTVSEPNIWYCIPKTESVKFHKVAKAIAPSLVSDSPIWLREDTLMIPPKMLVDRGVSVCRTLHEPGQFLVVFSEAYTASVSCGYNLTESLHFATPDWIPIGLQAAEAMAGSYIPDLFSMAKLLMQLAHKEKLSVSTQTCLLPALRSLVEKELSLRRELKDAGLRTWERMGGMVEVQDGSKKKNNLVYMEVQEERCEISKQICYLSMVVTEGENKVYSLQQALSNKPKKDLKKCKLLYRFKEKELRSIVGVVEAHVTGVGSPQKIKPATKSVKAATS